LLVGRQRSMMDAAVAVVSANGFTAKGVLTDDEALTEIASGDFAVVTIGGGVEPDSRSRIKSAAAASKIASLDVFGPDDLVNKLKKIG